MLEAKIANQATVLRYLARAPARRETRAGADLLAAARTLRSIECRLKAEANVPPLETRSSRLMGHEGLAAARYWAALEEITPREFGFPGRRPRSPDDPVNMSMNYAYGLLYAEVWRAVVRAGLDPSIGFLHVAEGSGGGLVYDLIEELRAPLADRLVFSLIGRGWKPEKSARNPARLSPHSLRIIVAAFGKQGLRKFRRGRSTVRAGELPWIQAKALRDLLLGETDQYQAFRFRW